MYKNLIEEIHLELLSRQHYKGVARKSFKTWSVQRIKFSTLSPEEQGEWIEEERSNSTDSTPLALSRNHCRPT